MAGAAAGDCVFPASHDALRFAIPRLAPQCLADEDRRSLARLPSCESGDAVGSDNVAEVNNLAVFLPVGTRRLAGIDWTGTVPLAAKKFHAGATAARLSCVPHTVLDHGGVAIVFERLQPDAVTRYARHAALLILAKFSGPPSEFSTLPSGQTVQCHPFGIPADSGRQKMPCVIESTTPPFGSTMAPVQACE